MVAIWNDMTAEGRDNFTEWHNREHIPERLGIDGFLRGRRYIATTGTPEYFTLYEVRDTDVLAGAPYLARLNNPTPWTTRSVAHFRNVARSLCRTDISSGAGSGGLLATLRFDCPTQHDTALMSWLTATLADLARRPGIAAHHVCRADLAVSTAKTAEQTGRPDNAVPRWVVMVEASTEAPLAAALADTLAKTSFSAFAVTDFAAGIYDLQFDQLSHP